MDDVLDVVTWPVAVKGASITLAQEVRRGEDVLVKAEVRVAFISDGRAQPIPKSLRALMKADLISLIGAIGERPSTSAAIAAIDCAPDQPTRPSCRARRFRPSPVRPPRKRPAWPRMPGIRATRCGSRWPIPRTAAGAIAREVFQGRDAIVAFLTRKWEKEHDYRLIKDLWAFDGNRIAVRFQYEWHDAGGQWHRSYGNEQWEFDEHGLMRRREASINDIAIAEKDRRFHWPAPGPRPADVAGAGDGSVLSLANNSRPSW